MPYLRLPNGSYVEVDEGVSAQDALARAREKFPDAFRKPEKADTGFTGAFKAGVQELKGDTAALLGRAGLMDLARAEAYKKEQSKRAQEIFQPTQEGWLEAPLEKFKETLGGSLPYVAAPAVAAGAATLAAPSAPLIATGAALGAGALQYTGTNIGRQMETGKALRDTDLVAAGAAAIPQAALDTLSLRMIPGIGRIFGAAGKEITKETAEAIAKQGILKTAGAYSLQGLKTAGIEGTTEVAQQFLERLQAGLDISDPAAREEYFDSFIGGAVLGGTLSVPGTAYERSKAKAEGRRIAKEEQDEANVQRQIEEDARKASPEYRLELETKRNDLQAQISSLEAIAKDKNLEKEDRAEASRRAKELKAELRPVLAELKETPAETAKKTVDDILEERRVATEQAQEAEKVRQEAALKAREEEDITVKRHQALSNEVDSLQTDLQNAMKAGDAAKVDEIGAMLDKRRVELDVLSKAAQDAGISVLDVNAQLRAANKELNAAKKALATASEDETIALDAAKRAELTQAVRDAQAKVAEVQEKVELDKVRQAESKALAAKQAQRVGVLEEEEAGAPTFTDEERDLMARKDVDSRLAGTIASANYFSKLLDTAKGTFLDKEINAKKLTHEGLEALGLDEAQTPGKPFKKSKPRSFDVRSKDTDKLQQQVLDLLDQIDANEQLAKRYNLDIPADPRTPYLQGVLAKLQELPAATREKAPPSKVELLRKTRGEETVIPVLAKFKGKAEGISDYTPAQIARIRKDLENIKKQLAPQPKVKGIQPAKELDKKTRARLERRKTRLEQDLKDAQLGAKEVQAKPKVSQRIESSIETLKNLQAENDTPEIRQRIAKAEGALARAKAKEETVFVPEGGRLVVPAKRAEGALADAMDGIDSLRKGEFFGGAASKEGSLETRTRAQAIDEIMNDVETYIRATISEINVNREGRGKKPLNAVQKQDLSSLIYEILIGKAIRATGWRAEQQRFGTETEAATKKAADNFQEQYRQALERSELSGNDLFSNKGEGTAQLNILKKAVSVLEDKYNDFTDKLNEANVKNDPDTIEYYKPKVQRFEKAYKAAVKEYEKAREEFTKGEMRGKGEIRTGMREEERVDIRKDMDLLKYTFGFRSPELNKKPEIEEETAVAMPQQEMPDSITELQNQAKNIMLQAQGIAKGIREAINMLLPSEARKAKATLDKFNKDKTSVIDIAAELQQGNIIKDFDEAVVLDKQAANFQRNYAQDSISYAGVESAEKITADMHDAAATLREDAYKRVNKLLDSMKATATNAVVTATKEAKDAYRDAYKQLAALNEEYRTLTKEIDKAVEEFHTSRMAKEGVERAKEALTVDTRSGEAIRRSQQVAARQTGLGLTGISATREIKQVVISNIAVTNMFKKVGPLRKAYEAKNAGPKGVNLNENERQAEQATLDKAYEDKLADFRAYAAKEGISTAEGEFGSLFIDLAQQKANSTEASKLKGRIEKYRAEAENIAMRFSESTTTKKVAAPETRAEQVEKVKELQSEQTEETKRSIERKRNALTAKQRAKMVDEIQKELDTLLSKPMPDKKTAPKAHDNYVIKRDSLKAQLEVATNADFETLRKRANIREAADLRYKPPSKIKLEKELKKLKKQQAEKDTPSLRARIAKVEGSLKYIEDAKTKETGIGAQGYIEERAIAAEQATKAREAALQQPLPTAEEKRKITLAKKTEERIGFKKQAINEKVLSDSFEKALKGYNYEVEGIRRAGLTPSEYKALTTKAEKQKLNVWENESADADVPFDDFREVWQGMRDDFDPRIEPAHGGKGLTKASVQSHIKSVSLPKGLKVIVVSKLTPTLRGAGMKHGLTDAALNGLRGGVTPDGTVFIVAEAHADIKDLNATLAHEITGHLGVEQTLGQAGMDALARQVAKQEGGVFKLADKLGVGEDALAAYMAAKRAGKDEAFAQAKALREVIAHTEEARVDKNFLQKAGEFIKALVGAVRAALRKMGVNLDINTNDVYKILRKARKEFKEYAPGAYTGRDGEFQYRAKAPIFGGGAPGIVSLADKLMPKQKGLKERVFGGNTGLAFETRYVNRAAPIEAVFRNKGLENSIQATQVQYSLSMHDQRMAWTAQGVSNGIPKLRKGKGGGYILESLEGANLVKLTEALAKANWGDAAGVRDAYSLYRIAKRAANPKVGLAKLNFEGKITQAELDAVMRDVNSNPNLKSAFAEADKIYNQYNKDLMNLLVEVGALKPEVAADLVADNDYIPYYRVEKDEVFLDVGGAPRINIGNLQYQPYLHELVGGNERIVDIYTGALQNTSLLMDMALRNMATRNVAYALRDMGMLEVANKDEPNGGIRKGPGPASDRTIRFRRDGVDHYAVVNTDAAGVPSSMLVHGLSGVNTSLPNIVKAMGAPARLLRSWVTRNPAYAARQVVRDPMVAVMSGGVDTVPIISSLKEVYKAMRGQSEGERTLQSYGLIGGQVFTGTSEDMAKIMLQLTSGKKGWESYLAKADTLAMQGDAATRTVAFDSYIKQGLTEMEAIVAVHKMMPFSQRGTSPSLFMLSTMVPFLNAQIQGLNVLYKSFRGKMPFNEKLDIKGKLYRRGMMMASLSMIYAMMMEDDEAYKNANDDERYKNWFVYVPGVDEPVRVPIPFELGFIFKAVPEALVNTMYGDKRASEAARALTKLVAESVPIGPSTIPQAVKSPIEIMANYSFYTGRPIISDRMKDLDPAERFNDNTLELSKLVGSVTGSIPILGNYLSPVQLEYLIRGYVGGLPLAVASMTNPIMRSAEAGNKPEMRASDMPVIGSFFQPVDAGGVINRAYRDMEDIIKSKQTYDKLESENRVREANAYLDAKADLIGLASLAGTFRQKMGELTKQERAIKSDPDLSGPEKRKMLDEIRQEKIELAKELSSERE
jgi:hypothetical protein